MGTRDGNSGNLPSLARWLLAAMLLAAATSPHSMPAAGAAAAAAAGGGGPQEQTRGLYIVVLKNMPPVAEFAASFSTSRHFRSILSRSSNNGGDSSSASASRSFLSSQTVRTYAAQLKQMQISALTSAGIEERHMVTSYKNLVNGFAAMLSPDEVERLRSRADVATVQRSRMLTTQMNRTPTFLKLPGSLWNGTGGMDNAGEGIIVGILDSGIWPEHPSFSDKTNKPYGPVPSRWRGVCQGTPDFPQSLCNRKLIGATYFSRGWLSEGKIDTLVEYLSPRDSDGHGTFCASVAAGNSRVNGSVDGKSFLQISGIAPRARLAVYKVCWQNSTTAGCFDADIVSGVDKAWQDGVDVLSFSLGSHDFHDIFNALDIALFKASLDGMVITAAAGNYGQEPQFGPYPQLDNAAPWYMTVAASTTDRPSTVAATLGNGVRLVGGGLSPGNANTVSRPLMMAVSCALNPINNASRLKASLCLDGSLNATRCSGSIVVCTRGEIPRAAKAEVVAAAGGVGIIIVNALADQPDNLADEFVIPGMLVTYKKGLQIEAYVRSARRPVATIEAKAPTAAPAPAVASFSSRGPVVNPSLRGVGKFGPSPHILKPDLMAPGVNIISAVSPPRGRRPGSPTIVFFSGTSVSAPIVAGLAALLKQRWPTWSPARIKSAMMTTASVANNQGKPITLEGTAQAATPFAMGAGHVDPPRMLRPGLVYDVMDDEYLRFLNAINKEAVNVLFKGYLEVPENTLQGYNLNQPYICVGLLRGSVNVTRRVTNVGQRATYRAQVVPPQGVQVTVSPNRFTLAAGATVSFTVGLSVKVNATGFKFGRLTWISNEGVTARSVIAVQPLSVV